MRVLLDRAATHVRLSSQERPMPTFRANGIQLFYEARGSGEPLLLIAGFACDHSV